MKKILTMALALVMAFTANTYAEETSTEGKSEVRKERMDRKEMRYEKGQRGERGEMRGEKGERKGKMNSKKKVLRNER